MPKIFLRWNFFFSNISWENSHQLPFLSDGCLEKSLGCLSLPLTLILRQSPFVVHHCVPQVICGRSFPEFSCFQLSSRHVWGFYVGSGDPSSGPHICRASVSPTEPTSLAPTHFYHFFFSDCVTFTSSVLTDFFSWKMHTQTHVQWEKQQVKMKIKEKKNTS